jgi:DNA-binding response OmpR family regulator
VTAASCAAGLSALAREPFVLVISDLRLPDGDGLDVVRRARNATHPTPAIVVSGLTSQAVRDAAAAAGAVDFFGKPFGAGALAARVRELTGRLGP